MSTEDDLKSFRIDQFAMGGIGAPPAAGPGPAAPAGKKDGAKDAGYPTLESILGDKRKLDNFRAMAADTLKKLQEKASKGASPQEKADGQKAATAFQHMNDLLTAGVEAMAKEQKRREAKLKAASQGKK